MPLNKDKSNEHNYIYNSKPVCPHCDHKEEDWWEYSGLKSDGDTITVDCSSCGEGYIIMLGITYDFTTDFVEKVKYD